MCLKPTLCSYESKEKKHSSPKPCYVSREIFDVKYSSIPLHVHYVRKKMETRFLKTHTAQHLRSLFKRDGV